MIRRVARNYEEFIEATKDFDWSVVALDVETERATGLDWMKSQLIGFSICDGNIAIYYDGWVYEVRQFLRCCLDTTKLVLFHNAVYDLKILSKINVNIPCEIFDTMVASHLLDENRVDKRLKGKGHGLKVLAQEFLGADPVRYEKAEHAGIHSDMFYEYAQNDAIWTYQLFRLFKDRLVDEGVERLFREIEMPFVKVLAQMEMNGVLVDKVHLAELGTIGTEKLFELEIQMLKELNQPYELQHDLFGGVSIKSKINFGSPKQMGQIVFDQLGLEVVETTKGGKRSVGKRTLLAYRKTNKFVGLLFEYRKMQKLLDAFITTLPNFIDEDGRIRPSYHDTGTVTGRLSSSKPNFQQLPKVSDDPLGVRSCMIAPPGKKLIALDYNQQELRIMAELSKDEKLVSIIRNDGDLHLINANLVFNLGIPEEYLYKGHPEYETTAKTYKKDRDKGKIFSFGIPYGMGPQKLSKDFNVNLEEAEKLLANFFEGFPLLKDAIQATHERATREGVVRSFVGRSRHFTINEWGKVDGKALRQSFNFLIQGFGADLIRMSCIVIQKYADHFADRGIKVLMTVHDEVVLECNEDVAEEVAEDCKILMESVYQMETVPLVASYGIGNDYGEAK